MASRVLPSPREPEDDQRSFRVFDSTVSLVDALGVVFLVSPVEYQSVVPGSHPREKPGSLPGTST